MNNTPPQMQDQSAALPSGYGAINKDSALIHLFEKMGVPLINAIAAVRLWQDLDTLTPASEDKTKEKKAEEEAVAYATNLASLLNRTVSLSTALSQKLELSPTEDQKHRLDIASVSTLMIAHQYALMARIPEETEIPKIISSLETVLSFADYFSGSATSQNKAQQNENSLLVDTLESVVPLVQTIGRFSFGRNEKTLISEILNELGTRVETLAKAFGQDLKDRKIDQDKMSIFKGCAQLLTMCYEAEMNALMQEKNTDNSGEASISSDNMDKALARVWKNFDSRATLLRTVLGFVNNFFTGEGQAPAASKASTQSPAKTTTSSPLGVADSTQKKPSPPAGFSPIQAILDRAEGKEPSKSTNGNNDKSSDEGDNKGSSDGDGGNQNPMSFFTGK